MPHGGERPWHVGSAAQAACGRLSDVREVLKKLFLPGLEKAALVFLDEKLLGATSNAVERGSRRYRKMQKTVYRVRTQPGSDRSSSGSGPAPRRNDKRRSRSETTKTLHKARAA